MAAEVGGAEGPSKSNHEAQNINGFPGTNSTDSLKIEDIPSPMEHLAKNENRSP